MSCTLVHVTVKEGCEAAFINATRKNCENSQKEPGNVRFDLIQSEENRSKFIIIETYETKEAVAAHKETAHYKEWRDTVADMMAGPREGVKYIPVVVPKL
eukprot:Sspe_Gene.85986::Locus_56720_Transcript_1_1_Confidence_1.000_Length_510::g.85986::m.85986